MIKARWRPGRRIMADGASEAEGGRGMNGIVRAGEIVMMAGVASRWRAGVPLAVAVQTVQAGVSAGQGEIGLTVIESAFIPIAGSMAVFAGGGIILGDVIFSPFVIRPMAGIAERGRSSVDSVRMTGGAAGGHMRSGQLIARLGGVIEARWGPGGGTVAFRAGEAK